MTKIQEFLAALPEDKKALFIPVFGNVDKFYTVVYLIARNEHVTDMEKPDRYEDRLQVIRQVRSKVEDLVSSYGLEGKEIVADIASDYFEDYVNYKEPELDITNEEFIGIIQKLKKQLLNTYEHENTKPMYCIPFICSHLPASPGDCSERG